MVTRRQVRIGMWTVVLAVAASLIVGVSPAGTKIFERGEFSDAFSFAYDDCGFEVAVNRTEEVRYRIREGKGKTEGVFFLHVNYSYREVHTNTETDEWFVVRGKANFNEVKARRVEGTIFELVAIEAGQPFVVENSAGEVVMRDRGVIRYTILFDTEGDDAPGGVFLGEVADVRGPHPGFEADFCEIASDLIG